MLNADNGLSQPILYAAVPQHPHLHTSIYTQDEQISSVQWKTACGEPKCSLGKETAVWRWRWEEEHTRLLIMKDWLQLINTYTSTCHDPLLSSTTPTFGSISWFYQLGKLHSINKPSQTQEHVFLCTCQQNYSNQPITSKTWQERLPVLRLHFAVPQTCLLQSFCCVKV